MSTSNNNKNSNEECPNSNILLPLVGAVLIILFWLYFDKLPKRIGYHNIPLGADFVSFLTIAIPALIGAFLVGFIGSIQDIKRLIVLFFIGMITYGFFFSGYGMLATIMCAFVSVPTILIMMISAEIGQFCKKKIPYTMPTCKINLSVEKIVNKKNILLLSFVAVIICIVVFVRQKIIRYNFVNLPMSGRIVYSKNNKLMIYEHLSRKSKLLLAKKGFKYFYPRWSPNSNWILYKSEKGGVYLNIIKPDGTNLKQLCQITRSDICHWIDDNTIIVFDSNRGYLPSYKLLDPSELVKNSSPPTMYLLIDIDNIEDKVFWKPIYGGSIIREETIVKKADAIKFIANSSDSYPIVRTLDKSVMAIKSIYPFFIPDSHSKLRMILTSYGSTNLNIFKFNLTQPMHITNINKDAVVFIPSSFMWLDPNDGGYPSWSPDGEYIAFDDTSYLSQIGQLVYICPKNAQTKSDVYVMQKRTSNRRGIMGYYSEEFLMPRWSPDSNYLCCTHNKQVYIYSMQLKKGIDLFEGQDPDWTK